MRLEKKKKKKSSIGNQQRKPASEAKTKDKQLKIKKILWKLAKVN